MWCLAQQSSTWFYRLFCNRLQRHQGCIFRICTGLVSRLEYEHNTVSHHIVRFQPHSESSLHQRGCWSPRWWGCTHYTTDNSSWRPKNQSIYQVTADDDSYRCFWRKEGSSCLTDSSSSQHNLQLEGWSYRRHIHQPRSLLWNFKTWKTLWVNKSGKLTTSSCDESHCGLYRYLSYFSASVLKLSCLSRVFIDTSEDFNPDLTAAAYPSICCIVTLFFYLELAALCTTA